MAGESTAPGLLTGRYRLIAPIGTGGMGVVWEARDELLDRDVAVKELTPGGLTAEELGDLRERAIREARAIAAIDHPNVVKIYDVVHKDETPWIVMEIVRSRALHDAINEDGPMAPRRVAEIGLAILAGLRAAHDAGILHRDVKPANVLLGLDGRVVLTDFGLAAMAGDSAMTRTGVVLGSPSYLAPERALDQEPGAAGDLWSLGATLYAAVEGRPPFEKSSPMATLAALMVEPPTPPKQAGVLAPVLEALLRKDPAERAGAEETERLLRAAAAGEAVPEPPVPAPAPAPAADKAQEAPAAPEAPVAEKADTAPAEAPKTDVAPEAPAFTPGQVAVNAATTATLPPPRGVRRVRRRWWATAAAVVIVAGGTAWPLIGGARDDTADASVAAAAPSSTAWESAGPAAGPSSRPLPPSLSAAPVATRVSGPAGSAPAAVATQAPVPPGQAGPPAAAAPTTTAAAAAPPAAAPTTAAATTKPAATKAPTTQATVSGIQIWSHATNTCLDASNTGGNLQMWACGSSDAQRFTFPSDGTMRVRGLCVRIKGTSNGSKLGFAACDGSSAQKFSLNVRNDLVSVKVDKCVDVTDWGTGNGVLAQLWDCAGTDNQKWN
ncbi:protein kinase domain-containing protein [Actinoplanes sp. CA-054009]